MKRAFAVLAGTEALIVGCVLGILVLLTYVRYLPDIWQASRKLPLAIRLLAIMFTPPLAFVRGFVNLWKTKR